VIEISSDDDEDDDEDDDDDDESSSSDHSQLELDESSSSDHSPHVDTGSLIQGGALSPLKHDFNQLTGK
jgi:hypothetical protein